MRPRKLPEALERGLPFPLGATPRDGGVNFALFSDHATEVELCLFDAAGAAELRRYRLEARSEGVFHGFLPGAGAGLVYGWRVHGPYRPEDGLRFNAHKLLLDPYAREIVGRFVWRPEQLGYELGHPLGDRSFDGRDNARIALKARVAAPLATPAHAPPRPRRAPRDTVIYELHVKGYTRLMDGVPTALRGTYAGLAHPAAIARMRALGVTTLSLLPTHAWIDEAHLVDRGLHNYWGYNTVGFFAPEPRLAAAANEPGAVAAEFRAMVDALHAAGLEVIIDVVFNHTCEGDGRGPTVSWRGIDNPTYYRLPRDDRSRYESYTGTGNTVNVAHPRVLQMVMDSLRLWAGEFGVDGFRYDLAPVLARNGTGIDRRAPFFAALAQDPVLAGTKHIAEPWDLGHEGYALGRFPRGWLEWNDRYRDTARRFFLHRGTARGEFARRFLASSDVFHHGGRQPTASVNFIAAHDGFTLADVVSYRSRHNEANGEGNRDGRDGEPSDHCGIEGPSTDPVVLGCRGRLQRVLLAATLLSQGTPMLRAGDEIGQSQDGNNNAYCQDNPTSWIDWQRADGALAAFAAQLLAVRAELRNLRHDDWYAGVSNVLGERDLVWLRPDGTEMNTGDWQAHDRHAFGCRIGSWVGSSDGTPLGPALLLLFNAELAPVSFRLPLEPQGWTLRIDSARGALPAPESLSTATVEVADRSMMLLSTA